jgi:hypothetical protein
MKITLCKDPQRYPPGSRKSRRDSSKRISTKTKGRISKGNLKDMKRRLAKSSLRKANSK